MKQLTEELIKDRDLEAQIIGALFQGKLQEVIFGSFSAEIRAGRAIYPGDLHRVLATRFGLRKRESRQLAVLIGLRRNCRGYILKGVRK